MMLKDCWIILSNIKDYIDENNLDNPSVVMDAVDNTITICNNNTIYIIYRVHPLQIEYIKENLFNKQHPFCKIEKYFTNIMVIK